MRESWHTRIDRASELAARDDAARPLLEAYRRLLVLQRDCYASLDDDRDRLSGALERDLVIVRACVPRMLDEIAGLGPPPLAEEARRLADGGSSAIDSMLVTGWRTPSDEHFFSKVVLQPYASCLATHGRVPLDRDLPLLRRSPGGGGPSGNVCPFCGGAPQLSILHAAAGADGGGRELLCATCLTRWPFRRLLCAHCGEQDERRLGYFRSAAYDHLRVDACDTCRHYLKSVDLTRLGLAVPMVDEVAGAPLDLWARERGYEKIELNLVGL
jgi:Protein involved in formate dehydrogenase formation